MSTAHINALFNPRPELPFVPPYKQQLGVKKALPYTGIAQYVKDFETPEQYEESFAKFAPIEQRKERRERLAMEREAMNREILNLKIQTWNPQDYTFDTDAYKTLFVGRLSYLTDELKLKREMEQYGPVKNITFVEDKNTGKPRGYAFIEFEHERDMKTAYKHADGRKIDGRRILVDVERGRTVKDWRPRKVGGGLGSSRKSRPKKTKAEKAEAKRFDPYGGGSRGAANSSRREGGSSRRDDGPPRGGGGGYEGSRGGGERGGYDSRGAGGPARDDYRGGSSRGGGGGGGEKRGGGYDDYYKGGGDRDKERR